MIVSKFFAVLAPLGWLLLMACVASLSGFGLLQLFGDVLPLHKVVSKLTLILLLLGVFPLRKMLRFNWQDLGFASKRIFFRQIGLGFGLGILTLLPVLLTLFLLDVHVWDEGRTWSAAKAFEKAGLALFLALLIALGEEILFRGLLLSNLRRQLPVVAAVGFSALYYAALHFLKSKTEIPFAQQTIGSGFTLMAEAFGNWLNPEILSALLALFVVGVFLALLRTKVPQSLGLCIGCHAGWVWQIKISKDFFNVNPDSAYLSWVSAYDGVVGPLVSIWLSLAMIVWLLIETKSVNQSRKEL